MIRRSDSALHAGNPISCSADRAEVGGRSRSWRRGGRRPVGPATPSPPHEAVGDVHEDQHGDDGCAQVQVQLQAGLPEPGEELAQVEELPQPRSRGVEHREENGVDGVLVGAAFAALLGIRLSRSFLSVVLVDAGHHEADERQPHGCELHAPVRVRDVQGDNPDGTRGEGSEAVQRPGKQGADHEGQRQ